ncbi:hypothetical protein CC80DRAFT_222295 [Byssothecium circinans]|uniref:Uncharacterized protein n=1 Tax=Byssothecium circinans TaxID=147558 RepID=A0A6A5TEV0_9PLEO|nr:hypothetical protein CC80DRAFT_222295 [Byssothecium circinans]
MAGLHLEHQASAAQILSLYFDGRGLITAWLKIPPIEPNTEDVPQVNISPRAGPTRCDCNRVPQRPKTIATPLIVSPRKRPLPPKQGGNLTPIRAHKNGIVKPYAAPARPPPNRKPPLRRTRSVTPSETMFRVPGGFIE